MTHFFRNIPLKEKKGIGMGMESLILNSKWIYSVCSETLKSEDQGTVLPYL